ncbi:MAG: MgtC/SapB family protein [Candidatus Dactylopiibacterium sp.]|nr:MgtC/SapB family protein [Candidatus Dactylopiibacterium sp.]
MMDSLEIVLRLLLAALLGSLIGYERERSAWAAGLRTHMLVCLGSALFMIVSTHGFGDVEGHPGVSLDPSRVAAQVASGIGFLGAGTIILRGEMVRGLTTAAGLWSVAAVGLAVGGGLYLPAGAATLIMLLILAGLKPIEKRVFAERQKREFRLLVRRGSFDPAAIERVFEQHSVVVKRFVLKALAATSEGQETDEVSLVLERVQEAELPALMDALGAIEGVSEVNLRRP